MVTEVQFKLSMIVPSTFPATRKEMEKFFEETVSLDIANVSYEMVELEAVGRTSGFVCTERGNRTFFLKTHKNNFHFSEIEDGNLDDKIELGENLMKELDEFMDKNKETVHVQTNVALNCLGNEKILEDFGDLIFKLLR